MGGVAGFRARFQRGHRGFAGVLRRPGVAFSSAVGSPADDVRIGAVEPVALAAPTQIHQRGVADLGVRLRGPFG